jgi:hypothetical protein
MKKGKFLLLSFLLGLAIFPLVFAATESSISVEFSSQNGSCTKTADTAYWSIGATKNWTVKEDGTTGACFFYNYSSQKYDQNISCCPSAWDACVESEAHPEGVCMERVGLCSNLGSEGSCKSASRSLAERTLGQSESLSWYTIGEGRICYSYSSAQCSWENVTKNVTKDDGTIEIDSSYECTATFVNITGINATDYNGNCTETPSALSCVNVYNGQEERCDEPNGGIYVNYTAWVRNTSIPNSPLVLASEFALANPSVNISSWCKDTSKKYECSAAIQLPFFSLGNFLVSILAIAGVYFVSRKNYFGGK